MINTFQSLTMYYIPTAGLLLCIHLSCFFISLWPMSSFFSQKLSFLSCVKNKKVKKDCQNTAEDTFAKENEWSTPRKFIYFDPSLFCGQCHQFFSKNVTFHFHKKENWWATRLINESGAREREKLVRQELCLWH